MPVDEDGNRADIVMDPNSTISRMNLGRLYEQYFNAASRDTHKRICNMFGIANKVKLVEAQNILNKASDDLINSAFNYLMGYYKIVSPKMYSWFNDGLVKESPKDYLAEIITKGITLYVPTDNEPDSQDIVTELEKHYKPTYGPVSYIGNSGRKVITKNPVRIGSVYFILLEKIGDDWSAVSSGKLGHFGVLGQLTKADKYSKPARNQAVRGSGEAEVRILVSYIGTKYVAELMDRNNNPNTHKVVINNLLSAKHPTNVDNLIDRKVYPFGGAKPLQLIKHILEVSGTSFAYTPHSSGTEKDIN
jgi:hypothetical protein